MQPFASLSPRSPGASRSHRISRMLARGAMWCAAIALTGCASLNSVTSEVSTFGDWPSGRAADTYAFERLPSQLNDMERQTRIEDAARPAIEAAGFKPGANAQAANVTIQLSARVEAAERLPTDDPFWWHSGRFSARYGMGWGGGIAVEPGFGYGGVYERRTYRREVDLLIRDQKTGVVLYEAHASNSGGTPSIDAFLHALFASAMKDFPNASGGQPRQVTAPIREVR